MGGLIAANNNIGERSGLPRAPELSVFHRGFSLLDDFDNRRAAMAFHISAYLINGSKIAEAL